jgi:transposase-like protein
MEHAVSGRDACLEWQERLKRFETSGLSIDAFCRQEDVGRSQLADWLSALRVKPLREAAGEKESRSGEEPAFVPVTVKAQFIEILLPGGGLVRSYIIL